MAACAGSPQAAVRARGSNKCSQHHGKEVVYFCENCDDLVCADCVIQEHKGHVFEGLSNVVPAAKQKLQDFITRAELTDIPGIQGKLQTVDNDLAKNKNHFKNQLSKIRKQNEALKKELDRITNIFVRTCQSMEQQNLEELLSYKGDLQTRIVKLTSQIQDVKGALQSINNILVFDMSHVIKSEFDDLPKPVFSTPDFTPGTFSLQVLEQLLGKLNTSFNNLSSNHTGNLKVMSTFRPYTGHSAKSIHAAATEDEVWLSLYNTNTGENIEKMLLIDQSGQVKQTLDIDVRVTDFCLSPHSGNIWFCSNKDNSVREVKGSTSIIRFTTDTIPHSICVSNDDHVIIGHTKQVVKYTQQGQEFNKTSGGTPAAVILPFHLSECLMTSNLAVVDKDRKEYGGNDKPRVIIFNDQFQTLCTYTGEVQGQMSPAKPFEVFDVCFTVTGELAITDWYYKSVVLLTGAGRYLTTLFTDSKTSPVAVCLHKDGIWVSFGNASIKVLKNV